MACYKPIHGYRNKDGKGFTINPVHGRTSMPMTIPCGYCIGCRLEKSRQWAMRCVHEASLHEKNCFITLTFNPQSLKARGTRSVLKRDFQLFMKRLRKKYGQKIRYLHCGEYGKSRARPHYHALLFGFDFPDKRLWRGLLYRSRELEKLWPFGYSSIGAVSFESASYVARYVVKKRYGKAAGQFYDVLDKSTGEVERVQPEYATMSRRPGIGSDWIARFSGDVFPKDYVSVRGRKSRPCRFYDKRFEQSDPQGYELVKKARRRKAAEKARKKDQPSLESQEVCAEAALSLKSRSFEKGEE